MKKIILISVCNVALFFVFSSCQCNKENNNANSAETNAQQAKYICPMNCENGKTYDKTGQCPVCGMDLVKQ